MKAPDSNHEEVITATPLQFEVLVTDISARFLRMLPQNVDTEIEGALRKILQFFDADLSVLWRLEPERLSAVLTHFQATDTIPVIPEKLDYGPLSPWLTHRTALGEVTLLNSLDEFPEEGALDRQLHASFGIQAILLLPVQIGGSIRYALQLIYTRKGPAWLSEYIPRLRAFAEVLVTALERSRGAVALVQAEARLDLAARLAGAGLWDLDLETNTFWATPQAKEMYGFGQEEVVSLERLFTILHPDDVESLKLAISLATEQGKFLETEYRIVLPGGEIRWLAVQGARSPASFAGGNHLLGASIDITARKKLEDTAKHSLEEIKRLNELLQDETRYLRNEISLSHSHNEIVGKSNAIKAMLQKVEQVAPTDATVLVTGETGTGKELVARAIHKLSGRQDRLLVKVDCASLPSTLIESELFGRERGAYTGAMTKQIGRFQLADKGTVFLDEIGELAKETQAKLLRVLQEGCFEVLGSPRTVTVDVRVIAATNRDLEKEVKEGRFREDLYYRLKVFPVEVPALRERREDIPLLVWDFVERYSEEMRKEIKRIPKETMDALVQYHWPGNVRELKNLIEQAFIVSSGDVLVVRLPESQSPKTFPDKSLKEYEREHILDALKKTRWRIKGPAGAAVLLGVKPSTLYAKMSNLGIPGKHKKDDMPT